MGSGRLDVEGDVMALLPLERGRSCREAFWWPKKCQLSYDWDWGQWPEGCLTNSTQTQTHRVEGLDVRVPDIVLEFLQLGEDMREARGPARVGRRHDATRDAACSTMGCGRGMGPLGNYSTVRGKVMVGGPVARVSKTGALDAFWGYLAEEWRVRIEAIAAYIYCWRPSSAAEQRAAGATAVYGGAQSGIDALFSWPSRRHRARAGLWTWISYICIWTLFTLAYILACWAAQRARHLRTLYTARALM